MFEPIRGGTRGGQGEFKWSDVSADKDRENYLGHSINAPTGRWQKNKDVHWYNRDLKDSELERQEEIRKIKEAEADALAVALGFTPEPKSSNTEPTTAITGSSGPGGEKLDPQRVIEKEEKRKRKEEKRARKEEKRFRKEAKRSLKYRESSPYLRSQRDRDRQYSDHRDRDRVYGIYDRDRSSPLDRVDRSHRPKRPERTRHSESRSRSPRRLPSKDHSRQRSRSRTPLSPPTPPARRERGEHGRGRGSVGRDSVEYDSDERARERERDRRRWDDNARRNAPMRSNSANRW